MNAFANLATDDSIQDETDSVGGGGPLDTALYNFTVELAYLGKSDGGAANVTVHLKTEDGREHRETVYVTSGDKKGNKNYYENQQGEKRYLPGFNLMQSMCLLTVGKELQEVANATEKKVVKLYSFDAQAEVPTEVPVLTELLNQPIIGAVQKQLVDKRAKGDDGEYRPTGETREQSELDKVFRAKDRMTTAEIRAGAEEATFIETWREKNEGKVRDRTTKSAQGNGGSAGAPGQTAGNSGGGNGGKPTKSLFG